MQQKAQIGVTIIHQPQLLILDEPFKGLDPVNRQLFVDLFAEMRSEGKTILYSTHVVDEAQKLSDRLVMIKRGRRVLYGTVSEVRDSMGTKNVHIEFQGKTLPINHKLYTARIENNIAELAPHQNTSPEQILKSLVEQGVKVQGFKIDRPSLNQVFIAKAKDE